jgi:hypothetical protein
LCRAQSPSASIVADSATATGLKWDTPASGSLTLLSTTSLTGSSVTISSISQSYKNLFIVIKDVYCSSDDVAIRVFCEYATAQHNFQRMGLSGSSLATASDRLSNFMEIGRAGSNSGASYKATVLLSIIDYTSANIKILNANYFGVLNAGGRVSGVSNGTFTGGAIDSFLLDAEGANFSGGSVLIYGVN